MDEELYDKLDWKPLSYFDLDDSFMPFLGATEDVLEKKYPEYHKLILKKNKIYSNYPNLKTIFGGGPKVVASLNANEILKMRELIDLYMEILYIEEKNIFFQGMREQYFLFDKMGLLKSGTDKDKE